MAINTEAKLLRGCTNESCLCTGACEKIMYIPMDRIMDFIKANEHMPADNIELTKWELSQNDNI